MALLTKAQLQIEKVFKYVSIVSYQVISYLSWSSDQQIRRTSCHSFELVNQVKKLLSLLMISVLLCLVSKGLTLCYFIGGTFNLMLLSHVMCHYSSKNHFLHCRFLPHLLHPLLPLLHLLRYFLHWTFMAFNYDLVKFLHLLLTNLSFAFLLKIKQMDKIFSLHIFRSLKLPSYL